VTIGANKKKALLYWLAAFGYMALIFFLSSLEEINNLPDYTNDKVLHLLAYVPLAFLFYMALNKSGFRRFLFVLAFLFASFYGATDEFHQSFVAGRESSVGDLVADSVGALLGCIVASIVKLKTDVL
jgi:VanZ family protein